jgi:polysaccharide pyruvyl transferase WcaK-like protein
MHPTLAAMRNYVPSIVVAGANKKYELMKQVRLQHYTIGLSDDAKTIRQTIVRFLSSAPIIKNRLKERVPPIELQSRKEILAFTNKIKRLYGKEEDPS